MKRVILLISILLFSVSLILFGYVVISIKNNETESEKVVKYINNLKLEKDFSDNYYYPKLEIYKKDYVGTLEVTDKTLPIRSYCTNYIESVCLLREDSFVVMGTSFKDSILDYKDIDVGDKLIVNNFIGNSYTYNVSKITHLKKLKNVYAYKNKMILIVKNYYNMNYTVFLCD